VFWCGVVGLRKRNLPELKFLQARALWRGDGRARPDEPFGTKVPPGNGGVEVLPCWDAHKWGWLTYLPLSRRSGIVFR
jgi:hypothetical protein